MTSKKILILSSIFIISLSIPLYVFGKKLGIFNPQLKPVSGDWANPAHRVGEKPKTTWTDTTLEAAINKKPLEGKLTTRIGEVIDVSCYLQLGKHGVEHVECAKKCILSGQPVGLLEEDGTVYMLIPEEHHPRRDGKTVLASALAEHVGQIVEVTGTLTNVKGLKTLFIQGFVKKE
ncbi:MAG: hypothetical protein A2Z91_01190 [Deltaproteobacteria bacterium GWA2_38_16]|nr:MAG: hypothetical protein A2Z91_01190 [Deltaproteobacteria bacterium GWA2_38_16]OGQ02165.1 MAG: hypothetical protein A3D19_05265 [Deltaproteobacteria bacterium RIFCSPHIGHO2_02_FULL_38_15]OGQ34488.1 MAG: hypothetical protein A3A72_04980 [Deltaproteobacteria bacterium RIFCSPLOWO2_01_FULL_38_9]OGQ60660.1 MAG: hypothetical protein A3G92_03690 [Deltaproteobacteria bacterium RIFCSPLOWO2_12_FULL_38_8]HBQ21958.1 hypothetical protein [Deltaproteobacteria bacterium]